ncbi:unnamed protein product [Kuraishia capsulata CBS 1993]|uniref:SWIRM domain-containing protein n=1 Tax=Kuraishia capsulata CBS 1993 TaxID=1382522 RepID=W6MGP5_9ASCO|nr:uncharacterized protein KUCA_T00001308001 [Kuraishia capsulata CBS 1993]CDK25339.1 unnamed protein product [Kuraishia capsulata CBS 1993]
MSVIYQATSSSRQVDGCFTPSIETNSVSKNVLKPRSKLDFVQTPNSSTIPSPPLSPTTSNYDGKFADLVMSPFRMELPERGSTPSLEELVEKAVNVEPFPIQDLSKTELCINPWSDLNKPGYKKRQLSFLRQYKLNGAKSNSAAIRRKFATVNRRRYYVSDDTDVTASAAEERVRTRRVARERTVEFDDSDVSSANNTVRSVAPSTPKRHRAIKTSSPRVDSPSLPIYNYEAITDYCPPLDSLPANNTKCLKTEWKGQPMDLSQDPLIGKLHPAEVVLASVLRLPGNVYLDSKRRLFAEKVSRSRKGLPFRRTDAQKACKIDVNKASRLFAAFEKVGWLQDKNFTKFM